MALPTSISSKQREFQELAEKRREEITSRIKAERGKTKDWRADLTLRPGDASRASFVKGQTQGVVSLVALKERAVAMREAGDIAQMEMAELYGAAVSMQRWAATVGDLSGHPIIEHLEKPSETNIPDFSSLSSVIATVREVAGMCEKLSHTLKQIRTTQSHATENINVLLDALMQTSLSPSDLVDIAESSIDNDALEVSEKLLSDL